MLFLRAGTSFWKEQEWNEDPMIHRHGLIFLLLTTISLLIAEIAHILREFEESGEPLTAGELLLEARRLCRQLFGKEE